MKKFLKELLVIDPNITNLDLSRKKISKLNVIYPFLIRFEKLRTLNLSNNLITDIPKDLSGLKTLEVLNLTQNKFKNTPISKIILGLSSIPQLKHLFINTSRECEDKIISTLSQLETFNGANFYVSEYSNFETPNDDDDQIVNKTENLEFEKKEENTKKFDNLRKLYRDIRFLTGNSEKFSDIISTQKNKFNILNYIVGVFNSFFSDEKSESNITNILNSIQNEYCRNLLQILDENKNLKKLLEEEERAKVLCIKKFEESEERLISEVTKLNIENEKKDHILNSYDINFIKKPYLQTTLTPREMLMKNVKKLKNNAKKLKKSPMKKKKSGAFYKHITYTHLKEIINDIYKSKERYDVICLKNRLPKVTFLKYFYFYLNQKYGIKSVVLLWSKSIFNGIKKYQKNDNDINVFSLMLKNEIDEEFRFVQEQLKQTVLDLVTTQIKEKCPFKIQEDINTMLDKKIKGNVYESEMIDIINYMYNSDDAQKVLDEVKNYIRINSDKVRITEYKMLYSEFLTCLLNFQLKSHLNFLKKLVIFFKRIDTEKKGHITEYEFELLLKKMKIRKNKSEMKILLKKVDPFQHNKITFSDCVSNVSKDLVKLLHGKKKGIVK